MLGDIGRVAAGWSTGGLSEVYRALRPGGGQSGYAPLPFETGKNMTVDNNRITQEFQRATGRAPSQSELEQYADAIKAGDLGYAEIGQIIQGLPEQDRARLDRYADDYSARLGAGDQQLLDKAAATAQSRFASLGRPTTSGQVGAFAQTAGNLAQARQQSLAAFYGTGLQSNADLYVNQGQSALARSYQLRDGRDSFNRSLLGYQTQRNDFNTDLANQNALNRRKAFDQFAFGLAGAGAGAMIPGAGINGARLGAQLGSQGGGLFQ